jgi:hypothetical protein
LRTFSKASLAIPHDVELIDHDAGLRKNRLNSAAVRLPHIHTDDLHILAVGYVHKALDHGILLTTAGVGPLERWPDLPRHQQPRSLY